jgi:hypothetical protein
MSTVHFQTALYPFPEFIYWCRNTVFGELPESFVMELLKTFHVDTFIRYEKNI